MGEETARAFAAEGQITLHHQTRDENKLTKHRAFVTIADLDETRGRQVAAELSPFVSLAPQDSMKMSINMLTKTPLEMHNLSNVTLHLGRTK